MKTTTVDSSSSTMVTTAMVSVMEEVHVVLEIFVRACLPEYMEAFLYLHAWNVKYISKNLNRKPSDNTIKI